MIYFRGCLSVCFKIFKLLPTFSFPHSETASNAYCNRVTTGDCCETDDNLWCGEANDNAMKTLIML